MKRVALLSFVWSFRSFFYAALEPLALIDEALVKVVSDAQKTVTNPLDGVSDMCDNVRKSKKQEGYMVNFMRKAYSQMLDWKKNLGDKYVVCTGDFAIDNGITYLPFYMAHCL